MRGDGTLNEAASQVLMLGAAKAAAGSRQNCGWQDLEGAWDHGCQGPSEVGPGDPYSGSVGVSVILEDNADRDKPRRTGWDDVYWDTRNG
jgi:hypothetical protein